MGLALVYRQPFQAPDKSQPFLGHASDSLSLAGHSRRGEQFPPWCPLSTLAHTPANDLWPSPRARRNSALGSRQAFASCNRHAHRPAQIAGRPSLPSSKSRPLFRLSSTYSRLHVYPWLPTDISYSYLFRSDRGANEGLPSSRNRVACV